MVSEAKRKANAKWDAANMTIVGCRVTKKKAAVFKAACLKNGTTPNAVLLNTVDSYIAENEETDGK